VPNRVFGRTNQVFPATWLSLNVPDSPQEIDPLVQSALDSGLPIDISVSPALWGGKMRGSQGVISCFSTTAFEVATESAHATDLIQAHLIEVLSCLGREYLDFYFLTVRSMVEEYQLAGALEALEMLKQEGHVRYLGLACAGPPLSTLGIWQFNDAFEVVFLPDQDAGQVLLPLARERRVGVLWGTVAGSPDDARLVGVASAADVERALS
jgi:hypothetical protein